MASRVKWLWNKKNELPFRSQKSIENAVAILEEQFEAAQTTKAEVSDLQTGKLDSQQISK